MMLDWQRILLNIRRAGMSATAVSRRTSASAQHLMNIARGDVREPRFSVAIEILNLHADLCKDQHTVEALAMPHVPSHLKKDKAQ